MSPKKNSVVKLNVLLIMSILLFFTGITVCFFNVVSGLLLIVVALLLCPPCYSFLNQATKGVIKNWMSGGLACVLLIVSLVSFTNPELLNITTNSEALANNDVLDNTVSVHVPSSSALSTSVLTSSSESVSSESVSSETSSAVAESSSSEPVSVSSSAPVSSAAVSSTPATASSAIALSTATSSAAVSSVVQTVTPTITGVNATEKYTSAKSINSDTVAWISIPYTEVDFPVLKTTNNDFYLLHDLYKNDYIPGSIFMDYRDTFSSTSVSKNLIIYGHNKDDLTLFDQLLRYKRESSLINQSPYVYITTESGQKAYRIYATFYTEIRTDENPDGFYYLYPDPTEAEFNAILAEARSKSYYTIDCDVAYTDNIITLSTCSYRYKKSDGKSYRPDQRWLVMARELRVGESTGDAIPKAVYNPNYEQPDFDPLIFYQ